MYTKTQFGGKCHTLGTQNPKMTDLEDGAYLVSIQFSSVPHSCPTLCDPMDCSTPGFPVHQQLLELTQSLVHQVGDTIQPSHPLSFYPLLLLHLQSIPASGSFPRSQFFTSGGQITGASALESASY